MIYKDFQDLKLSQLGMGCMRLPVVGGDDAAVDQTAVEEMVALAMEKGVNYYDTAWGYHAGHSETAIGRALAAYPRDSFRLADKFPGYDLSNMGKAAEIFEAQLQKCQVEYFDFYLFHNVCEMNIDAYLDPRYGILDYLLEQKKNGRIRHLGFSCHGAMPVLRRFLEAYGEHMEFCQLQLNYIDWIFQGGKEKVELLEQYHIPVWVMEPLRGGRLARLSEKEAAALSCTYAHPYTDVPAWADRYVAWAYHQGYTNGVSATLFGSTQTITATEYEEFLLRALGYSAAGVDDYTTSLSRALALGALTAGEYQLLTTAAFLRAHVAYISYYTLDMPLSGSAQTLTQRLQAAGVFSASQLDSARIEVNSPRIS